MQIESVPIAELSHDPANARTHGDENVAAIVASLRRFGQQKPIVVDAGGVVRAGNGTFEAAKVIGWESIDIVRTELTATELAAYAIADNRTGELAGWDDAVLTATLRAIAGEDEELVQLLGFDDASLASMLLDDEVELDDEEDAPAASGATESIPFAFGPYRGYVSGDVFESFVERFERARGDGDSVMIDDVLREWLGL